MQSQQSPAYQDPQAKAACCKNHPGVPSRFFLTEHPELRYCKTCALNLALCGRKIERELSPEEYERKLIVDSVVDRLRTNIGEVEANEAYYEQLLSMVELSAHSIVRRIEAVDAFIRRLAQTKLQLETEFENQLQGRAKALRIRRQELGSNRLNIRQQLEDIESNFGSIIEAEDPQLFATLKTSWTELIAKTSRDLLTQIEFSFERNKIGESVVGFERQFKEIGKLRVLELVPLGPSCQEDKENATAEGRDGDSNCLQLVEELKLNLNANAQSKAKGSSRKNATERESRGAKKGRGCEREEGVAPRRFNH